MSLPEDMRIIPQPDDLIDSFNALRRTLMGKRVEVEWFNNDDNRITDLVIGNVYQIGSEVWVGATGLTDKTRNFVFRLADVRWFELIHEDKKP
jgi:hypothetical protein